VAAVTAVAGAKKEKDAAHSSSVVGTSVAFPHDTMGGGMGTDMDASSLSQTAILNDQQLRSALEPLDPVLKQDEEEDEKEGADDLEEAEAEAAATSTSPDESTGDMMSDILGVTMPDDVDETMEGGSDAAAKVDEAASLNGKEEEEDEEDEEEEGEAEMDESEKRQTDSLAAEEDKFNDIPPPSPKPAAANDTASPQASDRPIDDALRRADEALAAAKLYTSPSNATDGPKDEYDEIPIEAGNAAAAEEDQQSDDSQMASQDHENEGPIQPTDSAEDRLDNDLRKVTEDLAAAGISTSDQDDTAAEIDADADPDDDDDDDADADADADTDAVAATAVDEMPAGTASGAAAKNSAPEEADGDDILATPEVSVDDVALEGVRLSAIDDEVSPIKVARGEDGDVSGTSGGSAVNLDLSGPGGDGEWESDERAEKALPPEPKTLQEKAEAAVAAASAAIFASKLSQDNTAVATREEDPPAISLSLTDESLDDRKKRVSNLEATKQEGTTSQSPPKSPSSRSSRKKKKTAWRAVVDEASGDVYYYNRKTRETTWDRPEGVEIDERKRTFPDESGVTTVASEDNVGAEESTETIPLEVVNSGLTHDDATNGKEADEHKDQVNGDHEDAAEVTAKDEAEDETEKPEPEPEPEEEPEEEQEQDQASSGKWKAVADKVSGQTYYYHTATQETTWDKPDDYVEKKGMVKRGRKAAGALGGLIRRSTKHVIGGKAASKDEDEEEHPTDTTNDAGEEDATTNVKKSNAEKDDVVNFRNRYEVKDAETREAEAKKRGKALKFLRLKSAKASSGDGGKTPATATANGGDMETPPKKKSARSVLGLGKKKEAGHSPDALSQDHGDISSVVDPDGYSGMETSGEGDHLQGAADFSVAAMDTPDKVQLPKSATKGRFVPSLGSPSEKDELNMSDGSVDKGKEGEADNSVGPSAEKGEKPNQLWRAIIDANTLNTYYYNVRTKETTWDKPEGFQNLSKDELSASLE